VKIITKRYYTKINNNNLSFQIKILFLFSRPHS
jgi:hypothetical protein